MDFFPCLEDFCCKKRALYEHVNKHVEAVKSCVGKAVYDERHVKLSVLTCHLNMKPSLVHCKPEAKVIQAVVNFPIFLCSEPRKLLFLL